MPLVVLGAAAQEFDRNSWIYIGLGIMVLIYVFVVRPMMRKKKDPLERPAQFPTLAQQRSSEREMQNLLVEFAEMARQMSAQLDTRAAKLESLIQQADDRIHRLQGGASIAPADAAPPPERREPQPPDPRHADVYALADEGRNPYDIASALGRPRGEVELILALRRKDDR